MSQSRFKAWLLAARPQTLWAALAPVVVGTALARAAGSMHIAVFVLSLLGATAIQIATNLFNDWADFLRGADTHERLGPIRVTQQGLLPAKSVLIGSGVMALIAIVCGLGLLPFGGATLIVVGLASLLSGAAYTGGPYPLAYHGLGDVFAFLFFGPVAVLTTVYLHGAHIDALAVGLGIAEGLFATAILALNNLRDTSTDVKAHKRTLAVRFGRRFARYEHALCVITPFGIVFGLGLFVATQTALLLPLALLPQASRLIKQVGQSEGRALNALLGQTARLQAAFSVLAAVGLNASL